jgi:hypothetical protein
MQGSSMAINGANVISRIGDTSLRPLLSRTLISHAAFSAAGLTMALGRALGIAVFEEKQHRGPTRHSAFVRKARLLAAIQLFRKDL